MAEVQTSAWDKCKVPPPEAGERTDRADHAGDMGGGTAQTVTDNVKYSASLLTIVAVLIILWIVRPPFACGTAKAGHAPPLLVGRAFAIALVAGGIVLFAESMCALLAQTKTSFSA